MHYAITASGLTPTRTTPVNAGHGYHYGASSSPSFVLVLAVSDSTVTFCDAYSLTRQSAPRWVFEDLAARGGLTMRRAAGVAHLAAKDAPATAAGSLAVQCAKVAAERAKAHGAPVTLADYDRVELRVRGEGDVYGIATARGVVRDWQGSEVTVECSAADARAMLAAHPLEVVSRRTLRTA